MANNPVLINIHEFIKQSLEIHGKIRASRIPAMRDILYSSVSGGEKAGEISYSFTGEKGRRGKPELKLVLNGELKLICQRCLGELNYPILSSSVFEVVEDESEIPDLDENDETDFIVASNQFNVDTLIEEELLLSLPFSPRHENEVCLSKADGYKEQKKNPFQILEKIKN